MKDVSVHYKQATVSDIQDAVISEGRSPEREITAPSSRCVNRYC